MSDRTQSRAAVVVVSLTVLLIGWWLSGGGQSEPEPAAPAHGAEPLTAPADSPAVAPADSESASQGQAPELEGAPLAHAVDSLASALGQGTVRCPLPAGTGRVQMPWPLGQRSGDTLIAPVATPAGRVTLYPLGPPAELLADDPEAWRAAREASLVPLGALVWEGAALGETGACTLAPPETVRVQGRVAGTEPGAQTQIHGCGSGGDRFVTDAGTFSFEVQAQSECVLEAGSSGFAHDGTVVHPLSDLHGIVVQSLAVLGSSVELMITEMTARAEQSQADLDEYDAGTDAYSEALGDESLHPESAAILQAWRADAVAEVERTLAYQRDTAARFAASAARQRELLGE